MQHWSTIADNISQATGKSFSVDNSQSIGGGCINEAFRISGNGQDYFVKLHSSAYLDMFEAEAAGLQELASAQAIKVPLPVCTGSNSSKAWVVMEYISLGGRGNMALFGQQLAAMHRKTSPSFGWHTDNTIGSTPQINTPNIDWINFWREHRLGYQLELAARNGCSGSLQRKGERLMESFDMLFTNYQPEASLLHGDLWSGNYSSDAQGSPVIFDPAIYYGDREADLAMTELFGGFGSSFYDAYHDSWPIDPGYKVRKTFYNIYHILNHFNLFGGGYASQAENMIGSVLSESK